MLRNFEPDVSSKSSCVWFSHFVSFKMAMAIETTSSMSFSIAVFVFTLGEFIIFLIRLLKSRQLCPPSQSQKKEAKTLSRLFSSVISMEICLLHFQTGLCCLIMKQSLFHGRCHFQSIASL